MVTAVSAASLLLVPSSTATAGPNDYEAQCFGVSQFGQCIGVGVIPKAYSDAHPNPTKLQLTCLRRQGSVCIGWTVRSIGEQPAASNAHFLGRCVIKTGTIPNEPGAYFELAGGDRAVLDANCDGIHQDSDWVVPAGSRTILHGPGPNRGLLNCVPIRCSMLANLTMVDGAQPGYITAGSCESVPPGPQLKSSGNFGVGEAIANLSVVPLGGFNNYCIYNSADVNIVVDEQGFFSYPNTGGALFRPQSSTRLTDTRIVSSLPLAAGTVTRVETSAPQGATAVMVNLTMVNGTSPGYITAGRCSTIGGFAQTQSSGNFAVSVAIANLAVVSIDPDGSFCIYNSAPVDLIADLQGSFVPASAGGQGFDASDAVRTLDTRTIGTGPPAAGSITRVATGVAPGSTAALVNLTMVDGAGPGYITADLCPALAPGPQTKSSGNFSAGTAIANLSVVPVDAAGSFCIYNSNQVNLVVDVQGAFSVNGSMQFFATAPTRSADSRVAVGS